MELIIYNYIIVYRIIINIDELKNMESYKYIINVKVVLGSGGGEGIPKADGTMPRYRLHITGKHLVLS